MGKIDSEKKKEYNDRYRKKQREMREKNNLEAEKKKRVQINERKNKINYADIDSGNEAETDEEYYNDVEDYREVIRDELKNKIVADKPEEPSFFFTFMSYAAMPLVSLAMAYLKAPKRQQEDNSAEPYMMQQGVINPLDL